MRSRSKANCPSLPLLTTAFAWVWYGAWFWGIKSLQQDSIDLQALLQRGFLFLQPLHTLP